MTNTMKQEQHKKHLWVFREVQGVDQTLCKQIVTAIEPQYLEAFWDTAIGRINIPVHTLITQLYQMNDCITPQKLQEQEDMISQMEYDLVHPIDGIFTAINERVHYADAASSPYSQAQIINMAYIILNKTRYFCQWILDWNT